jgi:hypothetical protein
MAHVANTVERGVSFEVALARGRRFCRKDLFRWGTFLEKLPIEDSVFDPANSFRDRVCVADSRFLNYRRINASPVPSTTRRFRSLLFSITELNPKNAGNGLPNR